MTDDAKRQLKALYPKLSDEELVEATENLDAYLDLAWEIFEESKDRLAISDAMPEKKSVKRPVDSIHRRFDASQGSARSLG